MPLGNLPAATPICHPHAGRLLEHEFKKADWDKDGKVSLQDFTCYYDKVAKLQTQMAREGRIKSASHIGQIPVGAYACACARVCARVCEHACVRVCVCTHRADPCWCVRTCVCVCVRVYVCTYQSVYTSSRSLLVHARVRVLMRGCRCVDMDVRAFLIMEYVHTCSKGCMCVCMCVQLRSKLRLKTSKVGGPVCQRDSQRLYESRHGQVLASLCPTLNRFT